MSAFHRPSRLSGPIPYAGWRRAALPGSARFAVRAIALAALFVGWAPVVARGEWEATGRTENGDLRIAIAPFAGEGEGDPISQQLSQRFERLGVDGLPAPGTFAAERAFDPRADAVRTWAAQAAVENVVVGRVERPTQGKPARQIEAIVRSGHSGAELFRHAVYVPARAGLGSALDQLASAIVRDLGGDPLAGAFAETAAPTPPVSANMSDDKSADIANDPSARASGDMKSSASSEPPSKNPEPSPAPGGAATKAAAPAAKKSQGVDARLGAAAFESDAPIEIKADEAEIVAEGEGRRLKFTGSVWVHQDTLTLQSQFLEAEYVEGESEPRQLSARGAVRVQQGNRSARCDQANYLRASQQITCRGHAELVQGCDIVRGELIVLDLAANKARVEGAASIVISPKQGTDARCTGAATKK